MDPITMMVASIGMQFFNNYANSKKNEEIQEKQREFQRAAAEHDFERMRKLQAESAKLALELEAEVHKERVEDINNNYDVLLDNFAHSFAIQNWPLNVLPFVMKGESFGTLFNGTTQSVNLHCILTPSNCEWFNRNFYDDIDLRLEAEMNNKWNAQTTHPVVYYGGAWNRRSMNRGISVPNLVDLDDIELLRVKLKDVPVVVITPYFDPWLHFKVKLWGMGKDAEAPYRIDIPHGNDIEYTQRIFSYDYHKDDTEFTEDFENTTIEELVPYLECLIGFIADKYFWSMYGIIPHMVTEYNMESLPLNTQMTYDSMLNEYSDSCLFNIIKAIEYCQIFPNHNDRVSVLLKKYFSNTGRKYDSQESIHTNFTNNRVSLSDLPIITTLRDFGYLTFGESDDLVNNATSDIFDYYYSINEFLDSLSYENCDYEYFVFKTLHGKICVGYLVHELLPPKSVVAILHIKLKQSDKSYKYYFKNKRISICGKSDSTLIEPIPTSIFDFTEKSKINMLSRAVKEKIDFGDVIYKEDPILFKNAIKRRITFGELFDWITVKKSGSVKITQVIHGNYYYLLLSHLDINDEIIETCSFYMFSIENKIKEKFNNKVILTIKL